MTTNEALQSLANKLDGLDLDESEQHALRALITGLGHEAEVAGFGQRPGMVAPVVLGLEIHITANWSMSGDADARPTEEVAFYYNKIAF